MTDPSISRYRTAGRSCAVWACINITPPVALAAYAGSAIAKSNPMRTAFNASKLAIAAFIIPYIFSLNPVMLLVDVTPVAIVMIVITSIVGLFGVSCGLEGYVFADMHPLFRILAVGGGLALIYPGTLTDIVGMAIVGLILVFQFRKGRSVNAYKAKA